MMNPWDRKEDEGSQAFEAFKSYLELGSERSYRKVALRSGKSRSTIERWGARYVWVQRAYAFDHSPVKGPKVADDRAIGLDRYHRVVNELYSKLGEQIRRLDKDKISLRELWDVFERSSKMERRLLDEEFEFIMQNRKKPP